jgi:TrmH family RNA methyltransferase
MSREPGSSAVISGKGNPTIRSIRALRHRKERERTGSFFVEGIRLVGEAAELRAKVELCVVAPELLTSGFGQDLVRRLADEGIPCLDVTAEVFRSISSKEGPQGIGAVVKQRWESLEQVELVTELYWVAIDAVQDPGNLGTILRTSDAVGGAGIILLGPTTDPYDPAALRASMGAVFAQRLVRASFGEFAAWKQEHGHRVVGTSGAADLDYRDVGYYSPLVLLMGSEREGLGPERQALCDVVVRIPMVGRSDSLNLAVATGVMLYEIFNQLRAREIRRG